MCKNLSSFILPMKGVSDNNAPKKIKSKGNQSELKKPLQVLQLNKKQSHNDKSKNLGMWSMKFEYPWDWRRKN